jgi:hypothetical protein
VDVILLMKDFVYGSTPAMFEHIQVEDGSLDVCWHGVSHTVQRSGDGEPIDNPFHFPAMANRYKFWWKHLVLWINPIIGDRLRNCNATAEVVNLVLKGNTLKGNRII